MTVPQPHTPATDFTRSPAKPTPHNRKTTPPYAQLRFKLHTPSTIPNTPSAPSHLQQQPSHAKHQHPSFPQLLLHQSLPSSATVNPHTPSPGPILHLATAQSLIAAASRSLLSVWQLHPAYPSTPPTHAPYCFLQSQWQSPSDFSITSLALTPDASAIAISLQHSDPSRAQNPPAILLLHPLTCTTLIRFSIPASIQFLPRPTSTPSLNLSLAFFSSSQHPLPPHPSFHSRSSDLSPHLRYAFHQYQQNNSIPTDFAPAFGPHVAPASYDLAITGSSGIAALYRFTNGYACIIKHTTIDMVDIFSLNAHFRMCTAAQILTKTVHESSKRLFGVCSDNGIALFEDAVLVTQMKAESFRPLAICVCHRNVSNDISAVLLVSRDTCGNGLSAKSSIQKASREREGRLAFALKSPHTVWTFLPIHNVKESDLADVHVLDSDAEPVVIIQCKTKILHYRLTLERESSFLVALSETFTGVVHHCQNSTSATNSFMKKQEYLVEARVEDATVSVRTFGRRRYTTENSQHRTGHLI